MAYGTQSVPKVDKIFGPGNAWVTAAKQLVANDPDGAALDLPAGPSEVLVIADATARAEFVAADLLGAGRAQQPMRRLCWSRRRARSPRRPQRRSRRRCKGSAAQTRCGSRSSTRVCSSSTRLDTAIEINNTYAPEHLILQVANARDWLPKVRNAGSVFLGAWTPETMGDYCSGTNHVLPTYGFARAYSGLSLHDFVKRMTVQELTSDGLRDARAHGDHARDSKDWMRTRTPCSVRLAQLERGRA